MVNYCWLWKFSDTSHYWKCHNLLKKEAGLATASAKPNRDKVATVSTDTVRKFAEIKMQDLNAASIEAAMSMVKGTARSMGIVVAD